MMAPLLSSAGSERSVRNRAAFITGAANGLGRAMARLLAAEGALVAVTDVNSDGAEEVAAAIRSAGGNARAWRLDVGDAAAIAATSAAARAHFGRMDIVINNAGIPGYASMTDEGYDAMWDRSLAVMLTGAQRLSRAFLPDLIESGAGRVLNIASTMALGGQTNLSPYVAAKAGMIGLTRAMAIEYGRAGITVNCICPGAIDTGMTAPVSEADRETFSRRRIPARRYGSSEEIAHMALSICLPAASYLNGAIIPVDGGLVCQNG